MSLPQGLPSHEWRDHFPEVTSLSSATLGESLPNLAACVQQLRGDHPFALAAARRYILHRDELRQRGAA